MPFVPLDERAPLLAGDLKPVKPGQLCFLEYVPLMAAWRKERRRTTIHNEFKRVFDASDEQTAKFLAFLEFYIRHGHKYENEMVEKNGDI